jgi:hypothetical protein
MPNKCALSLSLSLSLTGLCPVSNSGPNRSKRCDIYSILLSTRTLHAAIELLNKYNDIDYLLAVIRIFPGIHYLQE